MTNTHYLPNRGDIVWMVFDPKVGREQSGRRPALVLSESSFSQINGLAIVCPITSNVRGIPAEVMLKNLTTTGVVLPAQVKSVDVTKRQMVFIERAPARIVAETTRKAGVYIGITDK